MIINSLLSFLVIGANLFPEFHCGKALVARMVISSDPMAIFDRLKRKTTPPTLPPTPPTKRHRRILMPGVSRKFCVFGLQVLLVLIHLNII